MTDIRFYHLMTRTVMQALPDLIERALKQGKRVNLRLQHAEDIAAFSDVLWTADPGSFIPHGADPGNYAADHPVWLTAGNDNPNNATVLMTAGFVPDAIAQDIVGYEMMCHIFDGRDDGITLASRALWTQLKSAGHDLAYWQQTEQKGWEKKI